jgi:HK97 family phage major capsid protein
MLRLSVIRHRYPVHLTFGVNFMSEFVKAQEETKANLISQVREVIDAAEAEKRGLLSEEMEKIDRIEADIRRVDDALAIARRNEERKAEAETAARGFVPATEERGAGDVFRAMARGEVRNHQFNFESRATLVPSVNTVPVAFLDRVYSLARLVGPMLETSEVIQRTSGESLRIPVLTAYGTAAQYAAGSTIADAEPTFSSILLSPYKQAGIVPIANELIADAGFDLEGTIAEAMGNSIGFQVNNLATVGTGTNTLTGIVTAAGSGVASTATALAADDLISLAYSIDGAARRLPGVGWMVATSTLAALRKLQDGDGSYLYNPTVGGPDTFLGYPIFENPAMSAVGSGVKSVIFGHLPSYKIATTGLDVAVSTDAQFEKDVTVYRWTYRVDGNLSHSAHVKYLTTS